MEIIGKVIAVLDEVSGENEKGAWRRGGFVVETLGDFPRRVVMTTKNERVDEIRPEVGRVVKARFDVSSHEFAEKWYTICTCYGIQMM